MLSKAVLSEGQVLSLCSVTKTVSYNYVHEDVPTRPITLLYTLGKVLKIIIIKILSNYIKEYSLLLN